MGGAQTSKGGSRCLQSAREGERREHPREHTPTNPSPTELAREPFLKVCANPFLKVCYQTRPHRLCLKRFPTVCYQTQKLIFARVPTQNQHPSLSLLPKPFDRPPVCGYPCKMSNPVSLLAKPLDRPPVNDSGEGRPAPLTNPIELYCSSIFPGPGKTLSLNKSFIITRRPN